VPNAGTASDVRVVIDETSFDLRALEPGKIEYHLDDFNDTLWSLREDGIVARKPPMLEGFACADGYELFDYLMSEPGKLIDRDTKNRFLGLIGKCPEWIHPSLQELDIAISDSEPVMALSAAFALASVRDGQGVACLIFGACPRRGFVGVTSASGRAEVFFFASIHTIKDFWRSLYELEAIPEAEFFTLAGRAFPDLIFNPDLSFRRFEGTYQELIPEVIKHLSVLNDDFLSAYHAGNGIPHNVEATLAAVGCHGISPESPNTHRNERVMRQRDVSYEGRTIRCEWHTKIEPHRNRIHFAFGDAFERNLFIGIFVDHLDT
jgi:hypothetical protein